MSSSGRLSAEMMMMMMMEVCVTKSNPVCPKAERSVFDETVFDSCLVLLHTAPHRTPEQSVSVATSSHTLFTAPQLLWSYNLYI